MSLPRSNQRRNVMTKIVGLWLVGVPIVGIIVLKVLGII